MSSYGEMLCGFIAFALVAAPSASAQSQRALTLPQTLQRALAANPRLTEADREVAMAAGRRLQAGAIPNPEISFELDNAFGTGDLRGLTSAESTLQLSQLIELGGKREARVAAGTAANRIADALVQSRIRVLEFSLQFFCSLIQRDLVRSGVTT